MAANKITLKLPLNRYITSVEHFFYIFFYFELKRGYEV